MGGDGPPASQNVITSASTSRRASRESERQEQQQSELPAEGDNNSELSSDQLNNLRNILSDIRIPQGQDQNSSLDLSSVITPEAVRSLLNDREVAHALFPHLPEGSEHSTEELQEIMRSPQFRQSLHRLSVALQSGQLGPLMTQLGLDPSAGNG
jgi:26S proteasome regulatory subunit N13